MHVATVALSSDKEAMLRAYLSAVYPTGVFKSSNVSISRLSSFFDSLDIYYTAIPGVPLRSSASSVALSCVRPPPDVATLSDRRFLGLLPCPMNGKTTAGRAMCLHRQHHFAPNWVRRLLSPRSSWIEVTSSGPDARWYQLARGSGIFYRVGRVLLAPSKNAALSMLLREGAAQENVRRAWPPSQVSNSEICSQAEICSNMSLLASRLRSTASGQATCAESEIQPCVADYCLSDSWDSALYWIASALGYDSLILTASLCCSSSPAFSCAMSHVIDVRAPSTPSSQDTNNPRSSWMVDGWHAHAHRYLQSKRVLSMRDPLRLEDNERVADCRVRRTPFLSCEEHPSLSLLYVQPVFS
eukprot:6173652-Pleurochrysis_carterae.AAC.15